MAELRGYCRRSVTTGVGGMLCLRPEHIPMINTEFAPSPDVVRRAQEFIAARTESIDESYLPRIRAAEVILACARKYRVDSTEGVGASMSR